VPGLPALATIAAGYYRTCATTTTGELYRWGANQLGELGVGDTDPHTGPVKVHDPVWRTAAGTVSGSETSDGRGGWTGGFFQARSPGT
jgi:alpha-tubulin suppressor-like RCC1 family protein